MSIFVKQDRLNRSLGNKVYYAHEIEKVRAALEAGGDPNSVYKTDYTSRALLYWAAERGRTEAALLLLEKGAKPDGDRAGDTPLMRAVGHGYTDIAKALLKAGADPNCKGSYRSQPLLTAANNANAHIIQALVEHGADINVQDSTGNTALHIVAAKGHANIVKYLMEKGADITIENTNMNTPANVAEKDYPRIADMIRGTETPAVAPAPIAALPAVDNAWNLTDTHEVARVKDKELIGYRVTEIFNFSSRLYTQIAHNMKTGGESQTVKGFAELGDGRAVEAAHAALVKLGGQLPDVAEKAKLPAPRQGT